MNNEVVIIDDDIKYVSLGAGVYKIDGEIVTVDGTSYNYRKVPVENEKDIRLVTINKFVDYYHDAEENKLSVKDYESQKKDLLKVAIPEDFGFYWGKNIDEEYAYKKFSQTWNPIYKQVQVISDPIEVSVVRIKETSNENPYIINLFLSGINDKAYKNNKDFYQYNQQSAWLHIIHEYMKKLGFTFNQSDRYNIKKEWSNATHSGIRYAKAFGEYLFNDAKWKSEYTPRGTIEKLEKMYKDDKEEIESIIKKAYIKRFGDVDESSYDFASLINSLKSIASDIKSLDLKVKEKDKKWLMLNVVNKLIEDIECRLEESVEIDE